MGTFNHCTARPIVSFHVYIFVPDVPDVTIPHLPLTSCMPRINSIAPGRATACR